MEIKELRKQTGLSQIKFAEKFHINKGTLANWEQGLRTPPEHVPFMIETVIKQEQTINNIIDRINEEKNKDRSSYHREEICEAYRTAFNMVLDIIKEEI